MTSVRQALSDERPFPGLRPFDYGDQDFFFGRGDQIASLYGLLDRSSFVAVIGSSGSGKSSLTRAGLLPVLEQENGQSRSGKWKWCTMRPGDEPIAALAEALANWADEHDDSEEMPDIRRSRIRYLLGKSSFGLADAVAEIGVGADDRFVLIVDQFEELFRYSHRRIDTVQDDRRDMSSRNEARQFVELLMEGRRSRERNICVLITMRSDFIGDCADFPGLPEAVSATQFLVPGLEREEIESIIVEPIKKAGSDIEPALVQQLLTDAAGEPDQLPVLQHCLLQLWEQAGASPQPDSVEGPANDGPAVAAPDRKIETECYVAIDKMSGALSAHAEKILRDFDEASVEAVFRALSELKDGRAIRRALPYGQLREECGIPDDELRKIVDRFRADDCSFLVTSPPGVDRLADDTMVDIGHEALLRRWGRIRGLPGATGERGDKNPVGWLRQERRDGQRYQLLLSMLDNDGPSVKVEDIDRHWKWWKERTRTPRWAERYGGKYDEVDKLLTDGRTYQKNVRRRNQALAAVGVLCLLLGGYGLYRADVQQRIAAVNFNRSIDLSKKFLDLVLGSVNSGALKTDAALEIEQALQSIMKKDLGDDPSKTAEVEVQLDAYAVDFLTEAGQHTKASQKAEEVKDHAQRLSDSAPTNDKLKGLLLISTIRLGDALADDQKEDAAIGQYRAALAIAQELAQKQPLDGNRQYTLALSYNKVGDILRDGSKYQESLDEFSEALSTATRLAARFPENPEFQTYVPSMMGKIADVQMKLPDPQIDRALQGLDAALAIQRALVEKFPNNDVIRSNLASNHSRKAHTLVKAAKWDDAVSEFKTGIAIREELAHKDPGKATWLEYLAQAHAGFADALIRRATEQGVSSASEADPAAAKNQTDALLAEARAERQSELDARRKLSELDAGQVRWKAALAHAQKKLADLDAQMASQGR